MVRKVTRVTDSRGMWHHRRRCGIRVERKSSGGDDERDAPDTERDDDEREAREIRERVLRFLEETDGKSTEDE
jgi:hypothetical protein